jgi:uncharacterized protein
MECIEAEESDYLYVKESQIGGAGLGLHTAIVIHKDEIIATYGGELLGNKEAARRSHCNLDQYFISISSVKTLDSRLSQCYARYANDALGNPNSGLKNNAVIRLSENKKVCLVASRKIKIGEEIFCSYGKAYWSHHRLVNSPLP